MFRLGEENRFPWSTCDRSVWYALLTSESSGIGYRAIDSAYGSGGLLRALLELADRNRALLLGVWNGEWRTDLFVLDIDTAIECCRVEVEKRDRELEICDAELKEKREAELASLKAELKTATDVERIVGPQGGLREIRYTYTDRNGVTCHKSARDPGRVIFLAGIFEEHGIGIKVTVLPPRSRRGSGAQ